jgi:hypothetical protein
MVTFFTVLKYGSTLKTRNGYKPEYVYALQNQISKFYKKPHRFFCLTDHNDLKCPVIKLKHNWPGWWSKIEYFRFNFKDEVCFAIDLDTVIDDDIENIVDYPHKFTALNEALTNRFTGNLGSGLMAWSGDKTNIYETFKRNPDHFMSVCKRGDQEFIQNIYPKFHTFQLISKDIYSYKFTLPDKDNIPGDAKIIYFSGQPKPWQTQHSWIPKY